MEPGMNKYYTTRTALIVLFSALLPLTGCSKSSQSCQSPLPDGTFRNAAVVCVQTKAARIGIDILKKGGNAVDAAVAVSYALAVIHPSAGNLGGGGFMLIRTADGKTTAIDYREKAPAKAHRDMYLDNDGNVIEGLSTFGPLAVGVPGTVAGTLYALEKYGTMNRQQILAPAIKLAENGFILKRAFDEEQFDQFQSTKKVFRKPDGGIYQIGDKFVQKDLAKTLKLISQKGRDGFYKGTTADLFVKTMKEYGGWITHEDLANYQPAERTPVTGSYRGYGIISIPPPSSGGITLLEILNILEKYDIAKSRFNTTKTIHLVVEAEKRAFADRAEYMGDPDFVKVPAKMLISKEYALQRAKDIKTDIATPGIKIKAGNLKNIPYESPQTTHYSIIEKDGTAVAVTTTLNDSFGCYLLVDGAGFLLNNEMDDFSAKPGAPNFYGLVCGTANAIEPNKRMLSSMSPTIVTKDGKNFMVIGAMGGPTIITTVAQCIMNVIDHKMDIAQAVAAPRFHHQWLPDEIQLDKFLDNLFSEKTIKELKSLGHKFGQPRSGKAHALLVDPKTGLITTAADPRGIEKGRGIGY
jgi:gamma-glutamyltranspeptidase/glutathione hydrolase